MKLPTPSLIQPPIPDVYLEEALIVVERELAELGTALQVRDSVAIESHAAGLHRALAQAIDFFSKAAQLGPLSPALRNRLMNASGQVAAQRESLARATAALDRAIEVLIPPEVPAVYSAYGSNQRGVRSSVIQV